MSDTALIEHAETVMRVAHGVQLAGRTAVTEPIGNSWRRCALDHSIDPARGSAPTIIGTRGLKDRQDQHEELLQIATAEMDSLYDQICGSGYALLLTDASGVILCEKVDPTLHKMFRSAGLMLGADWSEGREGTNGIGTCISEKRPVSVHRNEHFRARHIGLSCSAAPIHDPSGALLGALDASTVDARATQAHTMALVRMTAQMIEKYLFHRRFQGATIVRFHVRPELVELPHDGALALAADGTVIAADANAVRLLGVERRGALVGRSVATIFDVHVEDLLAPTSLARGALWPVRDFIRHQRFFVSPHSSRIVLQQSQPKRLESRIVESSAAAVREQHRPTLEELAGDDPQFLLSVRKARRVMNAAVPILIQGPTGSGKECFARALHAASDRHAKPFVALNCGAIPEALIESELFGYRPGAFTGAGKDGLRGKILQSSGGMLLLDEIGDMPLALQTRFLRVLDQQEVLPLGAESPTKVDLHVVCATHRNLRDMVAKGEFREDLYFRLNGITFELPALNARGDKERLIRHVIAVESSGGSTTSVDPDAFQKLLAYVWPGNIRELRNAIRSSLAVCDDGIVRLQDLPQEIRDYASHPARAACVESNVAAGPMDPLMAAERDALARAIHEHGGNLCKVARHLGVSRPTLYRKLKRHRLPVVRFGPVARA